jgi:exo-beta-1,3-glucanase (GH17 family)
MKTTLLTPKSFKTAIPLTICFFCLAILLLWWWQRGLAVVIPDSTASVPCVSYAPFRHPGTTPFAIDGSASPEQIEEDLRALKKITSCVRTYGVAQGLAYVPQAARKLGMRVRLGVWIGKDEIANGRELQEALVLAKSHADVIDLLIVGNEVMLRQDLTVEALRKHLQYAKSNTTLPITYADVWEFWRVNASLKADVDLITIHVLPYWEDIPVSAKMATDHVFQITREMQQFFKGKPVWIGETGWPTAGRQRESAQPGLVEQTQVIREIVSRSHKEKLEVNIIEAFDQPWKRSLEGAMGGAWGLFNADGSQKVALKGEVVEDTQWLRGWWGAGLGGMLFISLALALGLKDKKPFRQLLASCVLSGLIGAIAGGFAPLQFDYLALWSRDTRELFFAICGAAMVTAGTLALLSNLFDSSTLKAKKIAFVATLSFHFVAASWALNLLFDSRYRGFPIALFAPAAVLSLCWVANNFQFNLNLRSIFQGPINAVRFLGYVLALSAIAMTLTEGFNNLQALTLALCWLVIAIPAINQAGPESSTL